jgi:septin 7
MSKFEQERQAHDQKMAKMEAEMKAVFQQKVAEKEAKLKQSEDEVFIFLVVIASCTHVTER